MTDRNMNTRSLAELLGQVRSGLTEAGRRTKDLAEACDSALGLEASPRRKAAASQRGDRHDILPPDPFRARALALEAEEWLSTGVAALRSRIEELSTAATRGAEQTEIDFFAEIEKKAKGAELACRTSREDGEATIECYANIKVDFAKGTARVNHRTLPSPHVPLVWRAVLEAIEDLQREAMKPGKFVELLSRAVRDAARRLHNDTAQPVPVHEAYRELLLLRQSASALASGNLAPYPRQLFALELSLLGDARPTPADATGLTVSLEPTTLPHQTVLIYSRLRAGYQRVGRLQCVPLRTG